MAAEGRKCCDTQTVAIYGDFSPFTLSKTQSYAIRKRNLTSLQSRTLTSMMLTIRIWKILENCGFPCSFVW